MKVNTYEKVNTESRSIFEPDVQTLIKLTERRDFINRLMLCLVLSFIAQMHLVNQITQTLRWWDHAGAHLQLITFIVILLLVAYSICLKFEFHYLRRILKRSQKYHSSRKKQKNRLHYEDGFVGELFLAESINLEPIVKEKRKQGE